MANSAQAVGRFLTTSSRLFDDFSDHIGEAARTLAQTIIDELQRAFIAQPIINFLTQFGQAAVAGLAGRITGTQAPPDLRFYQHGGVASGLAVVGERGPELVNFRSPARVYPNRELGSLLGGFTQVNHWNISGSDADTVRNAILEATPYIAEATKQGMIRDRSRPSQVRQAFRG